MSRRLRIVLSAGEASGDRLGAGLARALRALRPDVELIGMGGDEMEAAGVTLVEHARDVAVVGFTEVVRHLPTIRRAMTHLTSVCREGADLLVPIDFPDFNLRLAARAHDARVPIVYYVSPQVWAWRRRRVELIKRLVRRVLVLFPFERGFYDAAGVPATFVGHPAAASRDRASRADLLPRLGLDPSRPVVALLPGSRRGEVARLFPILLAAARRIATGHPDAQFVVPRASTLPDGFLEGIAGTEGPRVTIAAGAYPGILEVADAGAVASGTATLDAALAGLPFVAFYRMQPLTYAIARSLVRVDHIALPNLVAGRRLVTELVQGDCTPDAIAREVARLLDDPAASSALRRGLAGLEEALHGDGAFARAAEAVLAEAEAAMVQSAPR
ncbi:MAG TPA: lipid-A-disaccharide synthase [Candidatus Polarisedimenticolaceae bacterium]|nr:lipid-A-disaccharide synthase [Candidatus Polarisedimenticolaceae bacterium]